MAEEEDPVLRYVDVGKFIYGVNETDSETDSNYPLLSHKLVIKLGGIENRAPDIPELFEVTDLNDNYWLVNMRDPEPEEWKSTGLLGYYVFFLSKALQMDPVEARNRIYLVSDSRCAGFCVFLDKTNVEKLENTPGVIAVIHDIYWDEKINVFEDDRIWMKDEQGFFIFNERDEHLHNGEQASTEVKQTGSSKEETFFIGGIP